MCKSLKFRTKNREEIIRLSKGRSGSFSLSALNVDLEMVEFTNPETSGTYLLWRDKATGETVDTYKAKRRPQRSRARKAEVTP